MTNKVVILKGIPASGKSTYAKELVDKYGYKRINKDDLRAMLDNSNWSKPKEKFVLQMRDMMLAFAMMDGANIVIDDTNFAPQHEEAIRESVGLHNNNLATTSMEPLPTYGVEVVYFDTPLDVCISRNKNRNRKLKLAGFKTPVTEGVIRDMHSRYVDGKAVAYDKVIKSSDAPQAPVVYVPPKDKPKAILVDIDGTLAHMTGRRPYDWDRVQEDIVDKPVSDLIAKYYIQDVMQEEPDVHIIIMSGRDAACREITEEWLKSKGIKYTDLFMRGIGDNRPDNIVKRELFDEFIKDFYQVLYVLDDRNQVVDMWRNDLGLKVLQVAEGDF